MTCPAGIREKKDCSALEEINAAVKLLCLVLLTSAVVHCNSIIGFASAAVAAMAFVYISSLPFRTLLRSFKRLSGLFLLIIIVNTFFACEPLARPSVSGAVKGVSAVFKAVLAASVFEVFASCSAPHELSDVFALLLSPLRFVGIPAVKTAAVLAESVCLVPKILLLSEEIKSQELRTGGKRGLNGRLVMLTVSAFEHSEKRAEYLESRGLGLDGKAKPYFSRTIRRLDIIDLYAFLVSASFWALEVLIL